MGLGVTDSMVKVKKVLNRANKVCDQDWWSNPMGFGCAARGRRDADDAGLNGFFLA